MEKRREGIQHPCLIPDRVFQGAESEIAGQAKVLRGVEFERAGGAPSEWVRAIQQDKIIRDKSVVPSRQVGRDTHQTDQADELRIAEGGQPVER